MSVVFTFEFVVNFFRCFVDEKHAAGQQDEFFARKTEVATQQRESEQLIFQRDDPPNAEQEHKTHASRCKETDLASPILLICRQFGCQNRDENDVVNAKNNFQHKECNESTPCRGVAQPTHE